MKIRKILASDLDAVMEIVDAARGIMRASGNMRQWTGGYPDKTVMTADIDRGVCYGCEDDGKLSAVFSMIPGPDPTYTDIYGGAWLNEEPYLVVHRIASLPECHGVPEVRHYSRAGVRPRERSRLQLTPDSVGGHQPTQMRRRRAKGSRAYKKIPQPRLEDSKV